MPPLSSPTFGLIQEELASNPFHLLIAVTLLIRTSGRVAIPVFRTLIQKYPTAFALADDAHTAAIEELLRPLGLGAVRTKMVQKYARMWTREPPRWGRRFVVRGYGGHSGSEGEGDEEEEKGKKKKKSKKPSSAWEIGHMTQGPYALDSWRIFCRDRLRGVSPPSNHPDTDPSAPRGTKKPFQPEWMRVRPRDKELRAYLRWMWMREGWRWDPNTGAKAVLDEELRVAVEEGRVGYDDRGDLRILEGG
ncbi:DNA glycosylase [Xylaria sp. CBS 124048]|nr:DNA glycosylase [Xylaria sp. CBS 124048]